MSDPTPSLSSGLFKGLSPTEGDEILGAGERTSYPAGTAIFDAGDAGDAMFVISSARRGWTSAGGSTCSSRAISSARWPCSPPGPAWRPSRPSPTSRRS